MCLEIRINPECGLSANVKNMSFFSRGERIKEAAHSPATEISRQAEECIFYPPHIIWANFSQLARFHNHPARIRPPQLSLNRRALERIASIHAL